MITKKEMGYINSWPNKIPYPGKEYSTKAMEKLKECFDYYNKKYLNRKYTIQFSNNEEIDFEIQSKNLAHILGIDYKNLMKEIFEGYRYDILNIPPGSQVSSYILLEHIIANTDYILNEDERLGACRGINYYRVGIKCDIFSKLADLSKFNYGCINFSRETYDLENPYNNFTPLSTKYLYTASDELISPYFMMGVKQDNGFDEQQSYIVETLMAVENPQKMFSGQEVIIPTQILTDVNGILDKNVATPSEKIKLLREYQNIVNEYKIKNNINIFGDYYSMLLSEQNNDKKLILK